MTVLELGWLKWLTGIFRDPSLKNNKMSEEFVGLEKDVRTILPSDYEGGKDSIIYK